MIKPIKRNQRAEIQEIMDRISRHECAYCEQQQVCNAPKIDIEHARPKMYGGGYPQDASSKALGNKAARQSSTKSHEAGHQMLFDFAEGTEKPHEVKEIILHRDGLSTAQESPKPPTFGEYVLYLFVPKVEREVLVGDLTEEYPKIVAKFGRRGARFYFYKQVIWSILPLVRKTIIKWGLFGWVVELIRRIGS